MNQRTAQIKYAVIARVLRGIERAADLIPREDATSRNAMFHLIGRLEYQHFNSGICFDLDWCVDVIAKTEGV